MVWIVSGNETYLITVLVFIFRKLIWIFGIIFGKIELTEMGVVSFSIY